MPLPDFDTLEVAPVLPDFDTLKPYDEEREKKRAQFQREHELLRRDRKLTDIEEKAAVPATDYLLRLPSNMLRAPGELLSWGAHKMGFRPIVPPEAITEEIKRLPGYQEFIRSALGPEASQAVTEFAGEQLSSMTEPQNAALALAGVKAPIPVGRIFQAQTIANLPAAAEQFREATAGSVAKIKAGLNLGASAAIPVAIEHGLGPQTQLKLPIERIVEDASQNSPSTEVHANVRSQSLESSGQVPAEVSGERIQPRADEQTKAGTPTPVAETTPLPVTPEIQQFAKLLLDADTPIPKLNPGETSFAKLAGLKAKSVADLDHLLEASSQMTDALKEHAKRYSEASGEEKEAALAQLDRYGGGRTQFAREAIETATNTGSGREEMTTRSGKPLGERPLDWKTHPEVADWLKTHAKELGIELPEEITAPKTERATAKNEPAETTPQTKQAETLQQIRARLESGQSREGGFVNLDILKDVSEFGRSLYRRGMDFADWAKDMIAQLGEKAQTYLQEAWNKLTTSAPATIEQLMRRLPGHVTPDEIAALSAEDANKYFASLGDKGSNAQDDAVLAGMRLSKDDLPKLEALRKQAFQEMGQRMAKDDPGYKAAFGKNIWASGAIEGLNRKGPNYDLTSARQSEQAGFFTPGAVVEKLNDWRKAIVTRFDASPNRKVMDQLIDAGDNLAKIAGQQSGNSVRVGTKPIEQEAASAIIASHFDVNNLPNLLQKAIRGNNHVAQKAIEYAMDNYAAVEPIARRGQALFDKQIQREQNAGFDVDYHENYLPGLYDEDMWMGQGRPYIIGAKGGGIGTGFKKGKTFDSPFDALENPKFKPKSLNLAELVEHRVHAGEKMINRKVWGEALRSLADPTDGKPVVTNLETRTKPNGKTFEVAPMGYESREILPGIRVAVHEGYGRLFDALTGESKIAEFEPRGLPIGAALLEGAGALKHGLLLFDTYHASRMAQKQFFLTGEVGYRKGLSILEYGDADLNAAVKAGDITSEMADYARANREKANLLTGSGLNVGRVQESLYNSIAKKIPIISTFNKWVFEKMTRGAMLQSALLEFDRIKAQDPSVADVEVARSVSRDLNKYFGNLGRQGVFKSKTFQDAARLIALAPNWAESMARSEVGGYKQLVADPILTRRLQIGSLGRGMAGGLLGYFAATQLLNLATRHKLTVQNEEPGHKLDAWIPDITGKSKGFWLSPFGVVAEMTHDLFRYSHQSGSAVDAASRIAANKASPYWRSGKVLLTGKNYKNDRLSDWDRIKEAAKALLPIPIAASPILQDSKPGQLQRQLTASMGVKTEPVVDPRIQRAIQLKNRLEVLTPKLKGMPLSQRQAEAIKALRDLTPEERAKALLRLRRDGVFSYR